MNDPLPRGQCKGLSEALSWDSEEGRGGTLGEYYFLALIWPCRAAKMLHTHSWGHGKTNDEREIISKQSDTAHSSFTCKCHKCLQWWVRVNYMVWTWTSEAALPAAPLLLAALMLPVTLVPLGLENRRTTRNKCCLPSFGSTCTVTLTSLCRDESDTQLTAAAQVWVDDEGYNV